ncbi:UNC5C-like protein [Ptychodera flava]|uniref:UNC5C-like protein n=1 Tax=Ptychodera flava TaxID=63121 RepID=UPI00396A6723
MGQSGSYRRGTTASEANLRDHGSQLSNDKTYRGQSSVEGRKQFHSCHEHRTRFEGAKSTEMDDSYSLPKPGLFATLEIDHEGTSFELPNTGISVFAPPGSVPKGEKVSVLVGVSWEDDSGAFITWEDSCMPGSTTTGRIVSPVVVCLFVGLLEKPLNLRFPHCVTNGSFLRSLVVLQNFWTQGSHLQEDSDVWKQAAISNEISSWDFEHHTSTIVYEDRCLFFTRQPVKVLCACASPNDFQIALNMCVQVYHKSSLDSKEIELRVYVVDNNPDNFMNIEHEEAKIGGTKCSADRILLFTDNELDLKIQIVDLKDGWKCNDHIQIIDYFSLWFGSRWQYRTFTFNLEGAPDDFKCAFTVFQGKPTKGISLGVSITMLHVMNSMQDKTWEQEIEDVGKILKATAGMFHNVPCSSLSCKVCAPHTGNQTSKQRNTNATKKLDTLTLAACTLDRRTKSHTDSHYPRQNNDAEIELMSFM